MSDDRPDFLCDYRVIPSSFTCLGISLFQKSRFCRGRCSHLSPRGGEAEEQAGGVVSV